MRQLQKSRKADLARKILGNDFIRPEEINDLFRITYRHRDVFKLINGIPSEKILQWCKKHGYALVPGPSWGLSLLQIRQINPLVFLHSNGGWFQDEDFFQSDTVKPDWLVIKKTEIDGSLDLHWDQQKLRISKDGKIRNAAEIVWFLLIYFMIRKIKLFPNNFTNTSSVDLNGQRVYVGGFESGLQICSHHGRANPHIGLVDSLDFTFINQ